MYTCNALISALHQACVTTENDHDIIVTLFMGMGPSEVLRSTSLHYSDVIVYVNCVYSAMLVHSLSFIKFMVTADNARFVYVVPIVLAQQDLWESR